MEPLLVGVVVAVALVFAFTNGFHDAANAIATSVTTRALTPRLAVSMAAFMNLVGALLSTGVALTIGSGIVTPPPGVAGLTVVLAALAGAIALNLSTWWLGLPSSSSHALIGGLLGAGLASATEVHRDVVVGAVLLPMLLVPLVGFVLAYLLMALTVAVFRDRPYRSTSRGFRAAQTVSASAMALAHGLQDAQKTMGVIVLALVAGGLADGTAVPVWVKVASAVAIAAGTSFGGWRIVRTLGRRVIDLDPPRGFVAESVAAGISYATAVFLRAPISTTHAITAAIVGAGATRGLAAIRWSVVARILLAWVLTLPGAALFAAVFYLLGAALTP